MIPQRITLVSIKSIPIEIDRSWIVSYALLTYIMGFLGSTLFFLCLILHELGHSLVAVRSGLRIDSIRFFIFGGMTKIEKGSVSAGQELSIAVAGPAVSAIIGLVFFAAGAILTNDPEWMSPLSRMNLLLAAFNLIPAFPLDGSRALRAILWGIRGDYEHGTRQARICSSIVVHGMLALGIVYAVTYDFVPGILFALIAWRLRGMTIDSGRDPEAGSSALQPVM